MICKIGLCLVVAIALASCLVACGSPDRKTISFIRGKYNKWRNPEGSAGAAAVASGLGPAGAASAAAGGYAPAGYYPVPPQQPYYGQPEPYLEHQPAFRSPQHFRAPTHFEGGMIPEHVPAFNHYAAPAFADHQYNQYGPPPQPHVSNGLFKGHRGPAYAPTPAATSSAAAAAAVGGRNGGGAAAASASAGGRNGGGAASAAAAVSAGHQRQHYAPNFDHGRVDEESSHHGYFEPETVNRFEAAAGTFSRPQNSFEQGSYNSELEDRTMHEDGSENGDSYYNAQAHSKSKDKNKYTAFSNSDDDLLQTPNMYHSKKKSTNFVSSSQKQTRESGSGVLAQDKHSASYNKDSRKLNEKINQQFSKGSDGAIHNEHSHSNTNIDDDDEMRFDSRGNAGFFGVNGVHQPKHGQATAAAAAVAAAAAAGGASAAASGASLNQAH